MLVPFVRTLILYLLIVIAIRLMGKRQVGEMQPTELVITILVSAIASVPMQDIDIPLSHGIVPMVTLIAAEILISALSLKSLWFRRALTGQPIPIIKNGEIDQNALKVLRLNLDDILEDLRLKSVFDLRIVRFGQIETNGQISIMLNTSDSPVTNRALCLSATPENPFFTLISDGKLCPDGFIKAEKSQTWAIDTIKANGVQHPSEVFLLCADLDGNIIFSKKAN